MNNYPNNQSRGAALLLFVIFFLFSSVALVYLINQSIYADLVSYRLLHNSKQSFFTAESALEDAVFRWMSGSHTIDATEVISIGGATATTTSVVDSGTNQVTIETSSKSNRATRKGIVLLRIESGASFNFGVQTGRGGFSMSNSSQVIGNLFSEGPVAGANSAKVRGDVISAGPSGLFDGVHATGSVWANTIDSGLIEGDAYCQTIDLGNTTVWGSTANCPSYPDQATTSMPIPDEVVEAHKSSTTAAIAAGDGTLIASTDPECSGGEYKIKSNITFSEPTKIECDVEISGSPTVTLQDMIWVAGNLKFKNSPVIELDPVSGNAIMFIVDNEADRLTSSQIDINNSTEFNSISAEPSYIVLLSMNESAELGGSETAIDIDNSAQGELILYAGHGELTLGNSVNLKEATAYLISMGNSSKIEYESGLINLNFTSGPGGGFEIEDWYETF